MLVERAHHRAVASHQAAPAIDQERDAAERGAALEILLGELGPSLDLLVGRRGVAVAGQIDQREAVAQIVEVDLLGAARRVRDAGEVGVPGQRVEQARLADVRASGEGDLRQRRRRQPGEIARAGDERASLREEQPAGL